MRVFMPQVGCRIREFASSNFSVSTMKNENGNRAGSIRIHQAIFAEK